MVFSPFPDYHDPNSNWQQQLQYQQQLVEQNQSSLHHGRSITPLSGGPTGGPVHTVRPVSMAEQTRLARPAVVNCPRCGSTNTKFCYYNNRSFSQPRYWCRSCRRHWTHGGALRTVPIGGARRARRPRTTTATSAVTPLALPLGFVETTVAAPLVLPPHQFNLEVELPSFDIGLDGLDEILGHDEFGNPYY